MLKFRTSGRIYPRERLLLMGPSVVSDAELLAIVLGGGSAGDAEIGRATRLLGRFGGLRDLTAASAADVCAEPGVGEARFAALQAAAELGRRIQGGLLTRGSTIGGPVVLRRFLKVRMRDDPSEVFACIYLDNRHRVIQFERVFQGTVDGAAVHPREVVRRCIAHNAAALIVAHNHPSGLADPSEADRAITRRLRDALALIDVRLLDHMIVGDSEVTSLAEMGLL